MVIQYTSTFVVGFVVGFIKGWQLTLVIMSLTPLLALSSAFLGKVIKSFYMSSFFIRIKCDPCKYFNHAVPTDASDKSY